jgi:hypothetical protein
MLRRVLIRIIEANKVPKRDDLDSALFGAADTDAGPADPHHG